MSGKRKILIASLVLAILTGIVGLSVYLNQGEVPVVEVEAVQRRDGLVAQVAATGEIKPKEFIELQAEIAGVVTELSVKEGDFVEKGQLLLRIDPVQTESEMRGQKAALEAASAEARNSKNQIAVQTGNVARDRAAVRVAEAEVVRARQSLSVAAANFERKQELHEANLISREAYEAAKNERVSAESALATAEARLEQAKTQLGISKIVLEQAQSSYEVSLSRVSQQQAALDRSADLLSKTVIKAPLTGVITQMNVEAGERAVPGTLNNPAATLMVIADLSVIEAEVEVDETDIVDLELGQAAVVTVDALPAQPLKGQVTEIGNSAIQRSGQTQEARDFKVVIQLDDPPKTLRPGLSCTADITTATREAPLALPVQALVVREYPVGPEGAPLLNEEANGEGTNGALKRVKKEEFEGVFRLRKGKGKVEFVSVETGIMGETEIEVIFGLEEGDDVVTGSYRVLRTLKHGDTVKIERKRGG